MIAFDLASLSFGTSLLQRLQQFAPELSQRVRKCCLLLSKPFDIRKRSPSRVLFALKLWAHCLIHFHLCGARTEMTYYCYDCNIKGCSTAAAAC